MRTALKWKGEPFIIEYTEMTDTKHSGGSNIIAIVNLESLEWAINMKTDIDEAIKELKRMDEHPSESKVKAMINNLYRQYMSGTMSRNYRGPRTKRKGVVVSNKRSPCRLQRQPRTTTPSTPSSGHATMNPHDNCELHPITFKQTETSGLVTAETRGRNATSMSSGDVVIRGGASAGMSLVAELS